MSGVAGMQLGTFRGRELKCAGRFRCDAVPDVLNELDALGDGQLFEIQRGRIHGQSIHLERPCNSALEQCSDPKPVPKKPTRTYWYK